MFACFGTEGNNRVTGGEGKRASKNKHSEDQNEQFHLRGMGLKRRRLKIFFLLLPRAASCFVSRGFQVSLGGQTEFRSSGFPASGRRLPTLSPKRVSSQNLGHKLPALWLFEQSHPQESFFFVYEKVCFPIFHQFSILFFAAFRELIKTLRNSNFRLRIFLVPLLNWWVSNIFFDK